MLQREKKFFDNLEICRVILSTLCLLVLQNRFSVFNCVNASDLQNFCQVQHRYEFTRYESFTETFWKRGFWRDRIATRLNFRIVTYTDWKPTYICCKGFVEDRVSEKDVKCVSVCPSGCLHGMCNPNQPNDCLCYYGYRASINNETQYSECIPDCPGGCHGGECTAPFTCTCKFGQRLSKDQTKCESPCSDVGAGGIDGCGDNASCFAPDTCECNDGYTADINSSSLVDQSSTTVDISSTTIALDLNDNRIFHHSNITCKPLCEPECDENARCIAPNTCECNTGYQMTSSLDENRNNSECLPICEPNCRNGFCGSPNQCICYPGYETHSAHDFICVPVCDEPCINAKCTLPNNCDCYEGYENLVTKAGRHERVSETTCVPICTAQCPNGSCIAPELCTCNPGYVLISQNLDEMDVDVIIVNNISININALDVSAQQTCQPLCKTGISSSSPCITPYHCGIQYALNFTEEHSINGNESNKHDLCFCKYGWTGIACVKHSLCAIIFTEYNETDKISNTLQSFIASEKINELEYKNTINESNTVRKWEAPKCNEKCRISILSFDIIGNQSQNLSCYHFEILNETDDHIIAINRIASSNLEAENKTIVCFINSELKCNAADLEVFDHRVVEIVSGTVGIVFILVIIVGVILSIYFYQRKNSVPRRNKSNSDQAEAIECLFPTCESSTL